ncbi:unnamed protein product [Mycena citricolor]|uniref:Uncharacterized protein n=1 Tax=Mycena citricolor TaxID=2018698 RepID=A0AAD2HGA4_9AGAR|nr:unnamed protein product [Mycena citricolor]
MSTTAYTPVPTTLSDIENGSAPPTYPPLRTKALLARLAPTSPPTRIRRTLVFLVVLTLSSILLVFFVFPPNSWSIAFASPFRGQDGAHTVSGGGGVGSSGSLWNTDYALPQDRLQENSSPFFRDSHPTLHSRLFLARAQAEIQARGLDTCKGKLGGAMIDGYLENAVEYCKPSGRTASSPFITCFPAGTAAPQDTQNRWWPYPQSFCHSSNLTHSSGWGGDLPGRGVFGARDQCALTKAGIALDKDMKREMFLGKEFHSGEGGDQPCGETVDHPVLFVPRQDRWNPFHVGEDLVTTFLALTLFSRHAAQSYQPKSLFGSQTVEDELWSSLPGAYIRGGALEQFRKLRKDLEADLEPTAGLQLVFQDSQLPTESLFAPLYDRIGAWTARRTAADALGHGGAPTCFSQAFHSVGAGASLLSGTKVGLKYKCASELVWGASLWLRWVWGLEPVLPGDEKVSAQPALEERALGSSEFVNVLFLSREKFDDATLHRNGGLSTWSDARHILNEADLVVGLRSGLADMCSKLTAVSGSHLTHHPGTLDCTFTNADGLPGSWGVPLHPREAFALGNDGNSTHTGGKALRFATLDPTTTALASQLGMIGRTDVVVSVHAGALGLTLFMPTGRASVIELVPGGVRGNEHFHNMAHMMGLEYVNVGVSKRVNVQSVVDAVKAVVEKRLG